MRTGDMAGWLGVSVSTVKNWATEFSAYFSENAQGGMDTRRDYTEMDVRIMLLIAALRDQNKSYEYIHETLQALQDNEWATLPQLPERPPGIGPVELMPVSEHESAVNLEKQRLLREIAIREDQIASLETDLQHERAAHNQTREKLSETREALGELRGKLSSIESQQQTISQERDRERATWESERQNLQGERARERSLYTRLMIILAIVAAVAVVALVVLAVTGGVGG